MAPSRHALCRAFARAACYGCIARCLHRERSARRERVQVRDDYDRPCEIFQIWKSAEATHVIYSASAAFYKESVTKRRRSYIWREEASTERRASARRECRRACAAEARRRVYREFML